MSSIDEIVSILNSSLTGAQLPTALSVGETDYDIFYNVTNQRFEKILIGSSQANPSISPLIFGTVPTDGISTTNTEIINHINGLGFTIPNNSIKVLQFNVYIGGSLYVRRCFLRSNIAGTYNNGNPIVYSNLYSMGDQRFVYSQDDSIIIELGDIGSSTIEDYINATTPPLDNSWNLLGEILYVFKATINTVSNSYLYVGTQPLLIGNGQNTVNASDFYLLGQDGWYFIEGSWVQKVGNGNFGELEIGDIVWFKYVQDGARTVCIRGWEYLGGNKDLITSYKRVATLA